MNDFASDEDFMAVMLGEFLDESEGQLSRLNENLLVLDELVGALSEADAAKADHDLLNEMFRDAHSLKGLSAMLGFEEINKLTHRIENVFDAARRDNLGITRQLTDLMFQAIDHLTTMVDNLKEADGAKSEVDYEPLVDQLQQLIDGRAANASPAATPTDEPDAAQPAPGENEPESENPPGDVDATADQETSAESNEAEQHTNCSASVDKVPDPLADVQDEANIPEKYLSIFIDESDEALDELCDLLERYGEVQTDALSSIIHRIKGAAAAIGLNRIAKLAHAMEDLLQNSRERGGEITATAADALFFATDALRTSLDPLRDGNTAADNFSAAYQMLRDALQGPAAAMPVKPSEQSTEPQTAGSSSARNHTCLEQIAKAVPRQWIEQPPPNSTVLVGLIQLRAGLPMADVKAKMILERLGALGEIVHRVPAVGETISADRLEIIEFGLATSHPIDLIRSQLDLDGVESIETRILASDDHTPSRRVDDPREQRAASPQPASTQSAWDQVAADLAVPPSSAATNSAETVDRDSAPAAAMTSAAMTSDSGASDAMPVAAMPAAAAPSDASDHTPPVKSAAAPSAAEKPTGQSQAATKERPAETLRVDIERLDQLMNLSGQLVINKAQFSQLSEQLKGLSTRKHSIYKLSNATAMLDRMLTETNATRETTSNSSLNQQVRNIVLQVKEDLAVVERDLSELCQTRNTVNNLCEAVHQLDRITDGIQQCVMDTRMVPVGPLFSRFKRVVRDVTRLNGKDIALEIHGEKTELDKRMIDAIADPLIHMVRNSADHGVEAPEDRRSLGKPVRGTISLVAFHRGNRVFIQVRDDGKGLDPVKLREKAIAKGIISASEAERLSDQQCLQLIWEPGFSTAEKITEVSGRGMGMDIVRSKIEQLSGTVELDSEVGVGTTITIKLPLTMAILPSLLTVVASDVFAIPLESVKEIVRVKNKDLSTVRGINTATVRGRVISLVELGELFHWNSHVSRSTLEDQEHTLVIVGADGDELGLAVDRLLGEEDIVIKSLAENYRNVEGLAGASILGDGRVSLILDVASLLNLSCRHSSAGETEMA